MPQRLPALGVLVVALLAVVTGRCVAQMQVWTVDALVKVVPQDTMPPDAPRELRISAARGEYEAGQIVVRSTAAIKALRVVAGPLAADAAVGTLDDVRPYFLRFVTVNSATGVTPASELAAKLPGRLPDAMVADQSMALPANQAQPLWIVVRVPADAAPGMYRGRITVDADGTASELPLIVQVHNAVVPAKRSFKVFQWLFYDSGRGWGRLRHKLGGEAWDDQDWAMLDAIARNMVEHRQNMFSLPLFHGVLCGPDVHSVKVIKDGDSYRFDFSLFDRAAETFLRHDPEGTVVGGYLTVFNVKGRELDDRGSVSLVSPRIQLYDPSGARLSVLPSADVDQESYRTFLRAMMPALQRHLEEKGWIDNFMMSVNDETFPEFIRSRIELVAFVRQLAPKIRFLDANRNTEQVGACDMWFPLPHQFEAYRDFYAQRQKAGDEVGFYTCITPTGYNMNRFIDYPLIKSRLLPWYAFKFGLTGFLHWGYNAEYPPADTTAAPMNGDGHIVYRDAAYRPVPSIRQAALRDGIEDYELLRLVMAREPQLAQRLAEAMVTDCRLYTRDVGEFRRARELLLEAAGAAPVSADLRQRIMSLSTDHGWLLRDAPPPSASADGWTLVYSDDFERSELGNRWLTASGAWRIEGGRLTMTRDGDGCVLFAEPLGRDQRIEYDAFSQNPVPCDLSAVLCSNPKQQGGFGDAYFFGFGSEMNAFSKFMIRRIEYLVYPVRITPGRTHRVVCQREGDRVTQWVDGRIVFNAQHRDVIDGPANTHAGFYMYARGQFIDNVRVYRR